MRKFSTIGLLLVVLFFNECLSNASTISCIEEERLALLKLKDSFTDYESRLSSWHGQDCCSWKGVQCDEITGHVVRLDLGTGGSTTPLVANEVHSSLLQLKYLNHLDLNGNYFHASPIPKFFGSMTQLRYLNLSRALISEIVPHHLGNLSSLRVLDLSFMYHATVDDFTWVYRLSSLQYLDLSFMDLSQMQNLHGVLNMIPCLLELRLSGPLPQNIGDMVPTLFKPFLADNLINGLIPNSLCKVVDLVLLDLSNNMLFGNLPQCWGDTREGEMPRLAVMKFSSNQLSGIIPSSIGRLPSLGWLHLNNNSLYGEIPLGLKNCTILEMLDLGENGLSGNIPEWIGELQYLGILRLHKNMFNGKIPLQLCQLSSLKIIDLANNNLEKTIPRCFGNLTEVENAKNFRDFNVKLGRGFNMQQRESSSVALMLRGLTEGLQQIRWSRKASTEGCSKGFDSVGNNVINIYFKLQNPQGEELFEIM
ncbi:Receptor-like protein EIX2 [Camellia lanceoleosa]|uniref:Receptor-like protein EIX2 n=1 Tax=Camellia lanceoleosa TaxID=1840588 RepID=A0ACC0GRW9_9ERIC|nr:Receptor-like protein EIX2 [Camellia lanceoleosa]